MKMNVIAPLFLGIIIFGSIGVIAEGARLNTVLSIQPVINSTYYNITYTNTEEEMQDVCGAMTTNGTGGTLVYDDTGATLTAGFDCSDVASTGLTCTGETMTVDLGTSITSSEITDGTIAAVDIAASAINTTHILDGTILETDIAQTSSLDTTEIADIYLLNTGDTATGNYIFNGAAGTRVMDLIQGSGEYDQLRLSNVATNATIKKSGLTAGHYDNNENVLNVFHTYSADNNNQISFGGLGAEGNAPQRMYWVTSPDGVSAGTKKMYLDSNGYLGINSTAQTYPFEVDASVSGISIYTLGNISADDYITRTKVYDKEKGKALDKIKDSKDYLNPDGSINHSAFGYSFVSYQKQIIVGYKNVTEGMEEEPIFETITEEGVSLDSEIALLKQAIYELKEENALMKSELQKAKIYSIFPL